jgi:patatin-like phospholipase/acyl hydrolase
MARKPSNKAAGTKKPELTAPVATGSPIPTAGRSPFRILSLTGGGIRGALSAVWVMHLESRLGSALHNHVDLLAGTSTGSIVACALARGKSGTEIVELYRKRGREIFPSTGARLWDRMLRTFSQGGSAPKYSDIGLAEVLREELGAETRLGDMQKPTMVFTYDTLNRVPLVFKSWREEYAKLPAWRVVKASCSAPTYFPAEVLQVGAAELPLIDGGVVANDPTACAIAEAMRYTRDGQQACAIEEIHVVSIGTGSLTRPITARQATEWGPLEWAIPVIDVLMDGAADAVDYVARQILPNANYVRFQTPLDAAYDDMDNASATNINALIATAEQWLASAAGGDALEKATRLLRAEQQ